MRIGYISLFYGGGGTGSHVYKISNVMARFAHEVTVFTVYQNVDPPDGVSVVKFYLPFKRGFHTFGIFNLIIICISTSKRVILIFYMEILSLVTSQK